MTHDIVIVVYSVYFSTTFVMLKLLKTRENEIHFMEYIIRLCFPTTTSRSPIAVENVADATSLEAEQVL